MIRYSEEERETHLALWQESGLSKRAYSIASGLKYRTFLRWVGMSSFSEELPQAKESRSFIPISIPTPTLQSNDSAMIELEYPTGVIVRLPMNFPLDQLKGLLV